MILARISLVLFISNSAFANFVGNDTQNFNPTTSGLDFVTVEGSQTLRKGVLHTGVFFNRAHDSLPDSVSSNGSRIPSDDNITFGDLSFGYGLTDRIDVGLGFSYLIEQVTNRKEPGAQFAATGLNEVRLGGKYNLLKREPLGLSLQSSVNFNQSHNNPFTGSGAKPTLNVQGVADFHLGPVLVASNVGYRFRSPGEPYRHSVYEPLPSQWIASLAASYYVTAIDTRVVFELFGAKYTKSVAYVDANDIASEALLGVRYDLRDNIALNAGGGMRVGAGLFTPDARAYLGVNWNLDLFFADSPMVKNDVTEIKVTTYHGFMPEDIEALVDVDFDELTKRHEFQLRKTIPDGDIQGLKPPFEVIRLENFNFDTASAVIRPEYNATLDKLGSYLSSHPGILKVRIEGHTDSMGAFDRNRKLSQRRADALAKYVRAVPGMEGLRVEAAGFGADRPIADNGNFQGRKQNRRVEIRILRRLADPPQTAR